MMLVLGLVVIAFGLRLWVLTSLPLIETDGVRYVTLARQFQESGSLFDPLFHPFYPLCIAFFQPFLGEYEFTGRMISAVFGAALVFPAYAMAHALLGRPAAILATFLLAIHPGMVLSSAAVLSESTYIFLLVLGVWVSWKGIATSRYVLLVVAGLIFGFSYLVRPEGALYLLGLLVLIVIIGVRLDCFREMVLWAGGTLMAFLVVAGPYLLYLRQALGYWTLSGKILHNLVQDIGQAPSPGQSDVELLASHGEAVFHRTLENVFLFEKYALPDLFPGFLILFLLPGLLARVREIKWGTHEGLLLGMTLPPFATLVFHVESRVFLPVLPFLLPIIASGILTTATWLAGNKPIRWWSICLVFIIVAALLPYTFRPILRPDTGAMLYRQASQWIAATQAKDVAVMDRKPFIAFYSGRRFVPLGNVSPEELVPAARRTGARLVVLDSRVFGDRPLLIPLLYGSVPVGLEVLREFDAGMDGRLRILRVQERD